VQPTAALTAPITSGVRFSPLGPRGILRSRYDVESGGFKGSYDGKSRVSTVIFAPEDSITCDAAGPLGMNDIGRHDCPVDNVKDLRLVHGCLPWSVSRYHAPIDQGRPPGTGDMPLNRGPRSGACGPRIDPGLDDGAELLLGAGYGPPPGPGIAMPNPPDRPLPRAHVAMRGRGHHCALDP
jgi:hypothetical protein